MTIESASLKISALLGASSFALQTVSLGPNHVPITAFLVPIVSALVGGLMAFAVLKTTVQKMEQDVRDMRRDMSDIYTLMREHMTKLAHMEGRMDTRP
jgi:phosphoribosylcarboxyaminoimidazole (NCAIR) mutase